MMSVHWARADIRLRASGSDFDPSTSASPRWGWSNLWRLPAPDRWASFVRKKLELNTKKATSRSFGDRSAERYEGRGREQRSQRRQGILYDLP